LSIGIGCDRPIMRKALKIAAILIGFLFTLIVIREAFFSPTAYFFRFPGAELFADGKPTQGWVHRNRTNSILILTLVVENRRESYWINLPKEKKGGVARCNRWTASRFPVIAMGDVVPSCLFDAGGEGEPGWPIPESIDRRFVRRAKSVEFIADNGSGIQVLW
jgi:hypothetical protein